MTTAKDLGLKGNWGILRTIPEISVNKFVFDEKNYKKVTTFILTHLDEDIVKEVLHLGFITRLSLRPKFRLFMHQMLYDCLIRWTTITKEGINIRLRSYLAEMRQSGKIVVCETNRTFIIQTDMPNKKLVEVTMLYSGYDFGSIMLLFEVFNFCGKNEYSFQRILYTGNCRLSTKDLKMIPFFWNKDGKVKKFDELYIDTCYLFHEIQELPLRGESILELIKFFKNQLPAKTKQNIHFELHKFFPGRIAYLSYIISRDSIFTLPKYLEFLSIIQDIMDRKTMGAKGNLRGHCGCYKLMTNGQCDELDPFLTTKTVVLREEFYRYNSNTNYRNNQTFRQPLKYIETSEDFLFGKSLIPSEDKNGIKWSYFSHLSRYEIARFIRTLQIPVTMDTFIPLHISKNHNIQETIDLVEQSLLEISLKGDEGPAYDCEPFASQYSTFECCQSTSIPDMNSTDIYRFNSKGEREILTSEQFDNFIKLQNSIRKHLNLN